MSSAEVLSHFHPAVAGWFRGRFDAPTEVQVQAWPVTAQHRHALIAAPTGSGKTLAAFLSAINDLVVEGLARGLSDEVHVLYVSPLKALSNDIQKNLQEPLAGIRDKLLELGLPDVPIRDAVRTGDTSASDRTRMRKTPPHILVTTPESLFILLTSDSGRAMLQSVRSVIVDELHAVAGSKRGSHLMLSLERLDALCGKRPIRIGLSATVKPLEEMARFLVGAREPLTPPSAPLTVPPSPHGVGRGTVDDGLWPPIHIVDAGHVRQRDLALELPRSPLDAIMSNEVWSELYDRLAELIREHRTTLIFVNNRRLAERATRYLGERIGAEHVATHHGSLSKEHRLKSEQRLKAGQLKALVATSSLELGIDIGDIDLVCQMGSPRLIAALLQRVGRAGHAVGAIPKGRLFPLSLDDLVECTALLDSVRRGELDRIRVPQKPLDVLAQQIVAEVACREWGVSELLETVRRALPYVELTEQEFEQTLQMLSEGYSTRRGRRSAYLHYDTVNRKLRARRGAKITAVTNAGVIPDQFDCDVVLNPEGLRIGSIGEDFAFESIPGDIFQLGNTSYRIHKVEVGKVYVEDARGAPPTIPFWFGEAPARSDELSLAVSRLRTTAEQLLERSPLPTLAGGEGEGEGGVSRCENWLSDLGLTRPAAQQLAQYFAAGKAALGILPTHETIVFERFFDDVGDTHLVIHSPYGSRVNRAWGLALRKRFCRQFNFELQASALEDSIVLSLGPTHSFPLEDVKNFLKSATAREVLVQALLDAPMFGTRWRWNAAIALAVKRMRNGKRTPPQFQRADSEDLLSVIFPDQLACAENLTGAREIPDHPLVQQTINDCLHETMDVDGFLALLHRIESGAVQIECRDLAGPSPLAHAIIGAKPYAFLDDGDAEERRTRSITTQRLLEPKDAADLGRLDPAAIERVQTEAWPEIGNSDELHDALVVHGFLLPHPTPSASASPKGRGDMPPLPPGEGKGEGGLAPLFQQLVNERRAEVVQSPNGRLLWVAAERSAELKAALAGNENALKEILRNRLELLGPVTEAALAAPLALDPGQTHATLLALEAEGAVMRGRFTASSVIPAPDRRTRGQAAAGIQFSSKEELGPRLRGDDDSAVEWCERRLLLRIHRYTRERRRNEIQTVPPAQLMRFLFRWHGLPSSPLTPPMAPPLVPPSPHSVGRGTLDAAFGRETDPRREGDGGLLAVLQQLEGCAISAGAWEKDILPLRMKHYLAQSLDNLCSAGRIVWWRPGEPGNGELAPKTGPVRGTPITLIERESLAHWQKRSAPADTAAALSPRAQKLLDSLREHGASFFNDLVHDTGMLRTDVEQGLGELVSHGRVSSDSFAGLRALITPAARREKLRRYRRPLTSVDEAGRWSLPRRLPVAPSADALADPSVDHIARVLLRRYGVVFRKLLERESGLPPWRELFYVYRRLEARGEIRGGRFVSGFAGEQFALPDAAALLQSVARDVTQDRVSISAADPLNLVGIITPGEKVPALSGNRVLFEQGVPVAVQTGGEVRFLKEIAEKSQWEIRKLLIQIQRPGSYHHEPRAPQ